MEILQANPADAEAILEIQKLAFHSEALLHNNFNIPPLRQDIASLIEDFRTYTFYKVLIGHKLIGAAKTRMLENQVLWIGRVVVHPDYQRKGVGTQLMKYIESSCPMAREFELFTAEKSTHNLLFYKQLGYRIQGKFAEPEHEDIVLVKLTKRNFRAE